MSNREYSSVKEWVKNAKGISTVVNTGLELTILGAFSSQSGKRDVVRNCLNRLICSTDEKVKQNGFGRLVVLEDAVCDDVDVQSFSYCIRFEEQPDFEVSLFSLGVLRKPIKEILLGNHIIYLNGVSFCGLEVDSYSELIGENLTRIETDCGFTLYGRKNNSFNRAESLEILNTVVRRMVSKKEIPLYAVIPVDGQGVSKTYETIAKLYSAE
ncbi:MAG: hypothetical protein D6732_13470 [Methanobacteriota archaeon]|nr:MAG: hypothetical protein D6732_13470 [Euryarchaeota archaeon]